MMEVIRATAVNKVNQPGFLINTSRVAKNGLVETKETLTCTSRVTVEDFSGNNSRTPRSGSKQSKTDQILVDELMNKNYK